MFGHWKGDFDHFAVIVSKFSTNRRHGGGPKTCGNCTGGVPDTETSLLCPPLKCPHNRCGPSWGFFGHLKGDFNHFWVTSSKFSTNRRHGGGPQTCGNCTWGIPDTETSLPYPPLKCAHNRCGPSWDFFSHFSLRQIFTRVL